MRRPVKVVKTTYERDACGTNRRSLSLVATLLWPAGCFFFKRRSGVRSDSRESCAWSCGALSRLFRGGPNVGSESSSCCEVGPFCSISGIVGLVIVGPLYPCTVCCHHSSAAWTAFCRYNLAVGFSESSRAPSKAAEVFLAESQLLLHPDYVRNLRLACIESSQVCRAGSIHSSTDLFLPNT